MQEMWADKLGLVQFDADVYTSLIRLMHRSQADYTMFFRALCEFPDDVSALEGTFDVELSEELGQEWRSWLNQWRGRDRGVRLRPVPAG